MEWINKALIQYINKTLLKNIKPRIVFLNIVNMKNLKNDSMRKNKNRYDRFKINFIKGSEWFLKCQKIKKIT